MKKRLHRVSQMAQIEAMCLDATIRRLTCMKWMKTACKVGLRCLKRACHIAMLYKSELWILWEANPYTCFLCYSPHELKVRQWSVFRLSLDRVVGAVPQPEPGHWEAAAWGHGAKKQLHHWGVGRLRSKTMWPGTSTNSCLFLSLPNVCSWNTNKKTTTEKLPA